GYIQAYLDYLQRVGNLAILGQAQQTLITEYLAFLRGGGVPADFIFSAVDLDAATIDLYFGFLSDFVAFVRSGGAPDDFTGIEASLLARYTQLLANAGQLEALFGPQADVFLAYARFVAAGGLPNDFDRIDEFGLSDALIAEYTRTLQDLLAFVFDGGDITAFSTNTGDLADFILALEQSGALATGLADQRALLLEFAAFVRAGGAPQDYLGFLTLGLSDAAVAQYSVSITTLLNIFASGGGIGDFGGNVAEVVRVIQILEAAQQLDDSFGAQRVVLLQFVSFLADGGSAADFGGFATLGVDQATLASYVASITILLDFAASNGDLAGFDGNVAQLVTLIRALETSGQLATALAEQRAALLAFADFVDGGGNLATFDGFLALGLSDALAASYAANIQVFLDFLIEGGAIADFDGDLSVVIANIEDLRTAGQLDDQLGSFEDELIAFLAFLADGGTAADFTGFEDLADNGGDTGGGNEPTGDGYSGGPEVQVLTGVDSTAVADFRFQGAAVGAVVDLGAGQGNARLALRSRQLNPRFLSVDDNGIPFETGFNVS
ncbi:MAG: hypothetical protein WBA74_03220, partial [Cyclobacteriaceae bacterium]